MSLHEQLNVEPQPDSAKDIPSPAVSGIRYVTNDDGVYVRTRWRVPKGNEAVIQGQEKSHQGCTKRRVKMFGHRQRSGLWVSFCMDCERVSV